MNEMHLIKHLSNNFSLEYLIEINQIQLKLTIFITFNPKFATYEHYLTTKSIHFR